MSDHLSKEPLLAEYPVASPGFNDSDFTRTTKPRHRLLHYSVIALLLFILVCSLSLNSVLLFWIKGWQSPVHAYRSPYTGLTYENTQTYTFNSDYWGENGTLADELWDNIDINPIAVALSDEWVEEHNLEHSLRFPWDDQKGIYFIKAFHSLHCLKLIRRAFRDYEIGNEQVLTPFHIYHCLDAMRQDVMCKADDTPMPSWKQQHTVGDGQTMQCKDFDKLVAWTQEPERNACYDQIDDYRYIENTLERHAFCAKDSQYYPVMEAYFEKHGHKNPYGEGHEA
ncbi:MAG: hypothetical protein M1821_001419 [Bathelium mastoideum]|nr:MAG: hypothetical protein M1821_001419 [Bathelium mastoideum]KAI9689947.1 MAG: hypothetical protein M1822_009829 [Bathelium mastoideum]